MKKVLIASLDNWDSCAEVPYIFKKAGLCVDIFCPKNFWLQSNSYYDKWIEASSEGSVYITELLDIIKVTNYAFIILTDEPLLKILNECIVDSEVFAKVMPILKMENRNLLSSKIGFSEFCTSNNIHTPKFSTYNSFTDIGQITSSLKFPIINKNEFSWGGTDMSIINSSSELLNLLNKHHTKQPILFQEFIEGEEIRVDAFYYRGELMVYFCANVLTYAQNRFSYNTRRLYYNNESIKPYLMDIGIKSGANGFANINYIYEKTTGKYYLIEMDMRTNSWLAYSQYLSKNNFISCIKNIVSNIKHEDPFAPLRKEKVEIGLFYKDLKRAYWQKDIISFCRWFFNLKGYWRFLPFYDLKLSKIILGNLLNEFIFHRIKMIFRNIFTKRNVQGNNLVNYSQ